MKLKFANANYAKIKVTLRIIILWVIFYFGQERVTLIFKRKVHLTTMMHLCCFWGSTLHDKRRALNQCVFSAIECMTRCCLTVIQDYRYHFVSMLDL